MVKNKELIKYFEERSELKTERNRTVNIPGSVHNFYKSVSNSFDVKLTDLITNVLIEWQEKHSEDLRNELIKNIKNQF